MMVRNLTSLAALLSLAILAVGAQVPKTAKDPQSSFEPRSQPGAGQKLLEKFAGDWDVVKTLYLRPGEPIRMTGTCRQTMRHDGRFLQSEFAFEQMGTKTTGLGLIGFEAETGKFTSVWTDSRSTRMSFRQSQDKFDGQQIVLHGRILEGGEKGRYATRTVTRLEADGRKLVHRQYAALPDGTERLFMELVLTRKADKTQPPR